MQSTVGRANIDTDSQAAFRVLGSLTVRSKLVGECLNSLSLASEYYLVSVVWVPRNCVACSLGYMFTTIGKMGLVSANAGGKPGHVPMQGCFGRR